ncbi:MAG: hypothetical protein ACR2GI_00515 [Thermomicrobiales bacterium]
MIGGVALSGLASILVLSFSLQTAPPPRTEDPHVVPGTTRQVEECEGVVEYADVLFTTFDEHETFGDFWSNGDYDGIQEQDPDDVQAIVDDGLAFLEELDAMEVPALYSSGHEGLTLLFDADLDYVTFLGIDGSTVPDIGQWDRGLALLLDGEITLADACPDEVEALGGYLFFPIDVIEDALGI